MSRSRNLRLTGLLVAATVLAGCGTVDTADSGGGASHSSGGTAANSSIKLAGIGAYAQDPFWISLMCGGTKEAKTLGVSLTWKASNTTSIQDQQTNFASALLEKPSGVIIGAYQPGTFSAQIGRLMTEGTPVVAVNAPITPSTEYQLIHSQASSDEFVKLVADSMDNTGSIAILGGAAGFAPGQTRWKPLVEQLRQSASGVTILPTQYDEFDRNKAASITSSLLIAHPDLKAVYAISGPAGAGAAAAVAQAGKQGQVRVYSYDATPDIVAALKQGSITALLAQPAELMGAESVKSLVTFLRTGRSGAVTKASNADVALPLKVLTKDNVDSPDSAGYLYRATCDA